MSRRLSVFLLYTCAISGSAWGALIGVGGMTGYGPLAFFVIGGLGPTIAAYLAVLATRDEAPLGEFHARLLRWRVSPAWYAFALVYPAVLVFAAAAVAALSDPGYFASLHFRPLYAFVPLFFAMVLGGGPEELGWRGVAQPEAERRLPPLFAALFVGIIWAVWHLPLFFVPGTSQHGMSFPSFAAGVIGNSLVLAWMYGRTRSILLCIIYHASWNATLAMAIGPWPHAGLHALVAGCVSLVLGSALLLMWPAKGR